MAQQILGLDNILTLVLACQSQGFLLSTFFIFIPLKAICKRILKVHAAHFGVISTLTLRRRRWQELVAPFTHCLFHMPPTVVLVLKCITGLFQLRRFYCTAEGRRDAYTSEEKKGRWRSNNERFMTGIESGRRFYQPIINRLAPTEM